MERPPINYIVQLSRSRLADLMYYYTYYDMPCTLTIKKPHTEGLAAVLLTVDNDEAANFVLRVKQQVGCILHIKK